jgi:RNA polymerase sigma-70 factor (ECF subfamily)
MLVGRTVRGHQGIFMRLSPKPPRPVVYLGEGAGDEMRGDETDERAFTRFVKETESRLSYALAAAYGVEVGAETTADALAWAWEHWEKVRTMENPGGYLYRVGQSKARRYHRPRRLFPALPRQEVPNVDAELPKALETLSPRQRAAVVLIHGLGFTEREVADLIGISRWSVRTHAERALTRLEKMLEVRVDA